MKRLWAAALIGVVALAAGSPSYADGETDSSAATPDMGNPLARLGPEAIGDFLAKPLFAASRTAPAKNEANANAVEESAPSIESPNIQVVGIVQTPKETIAQVIDLADQSRYSIRVGDFIGPWSVLAIDRSSVTMAMEDRSQVFAVEAAQPDATMPVAPIAGATVPANGAASMSDADRIGFFGKDAVAPK